MEERESTVIEDFTRVRCWGEVQHPGEIIYGIEKVTLAVEGESSKLKVRSTGGKVDALC
jgi:hypothetical protein